MRQCIPKYRCFAERRRILAVRCPQKAGNSGPGGQIRIGAMQKKSIPPEQTLSVSGDWQKPLKDKSKFSKEGRDMNKTFVKKITAAALSLALLVTVFSACGKEQKEYEPDSTGTPTQTQAASPVNPLTGEADFPADAVGKRPIAVMVENSPEARPQWGLSTPDVVIEGVVEGGITRMMWLYANVNDIPKVGPTRSARHDYVELAEGLDAIYVHFGGSTYAYNTIKNDKVDDIDGMYDGKYFARDKSRNVASEHTAYTTGDKLQSAIENMEIRTEAKDGYTTPFTFASEKRTLPGGACTSVLAVFSGNYKHTFKYNTQDGLYYNYMNSKEMKDADGTTMAVANVLILYTDVSSVSGSSSGHKDWDLTGGTGVYVSNGTYQNIKWSKGSSSDATSQLKLTDESGATLQLNTGKMWIGFVPADNSGSTVIS